MGLLDDIVRNKHEELAALALQMPPAERPEPRPVNLRSKTGLTLLTEIKKKSPSAGVLGGGPIEKRAIAYARGGAAMISVLCDKKYFDGSFEDVKRVRDALDGAGLEVPILAKEFVVDPMQVAWARASGASAVLIIVRIIDDASLLQLLAAARSHELAALVEVSSAAELERAVKAGAKVIGVNARDLDSLGVDTHAATRVLSAIPPNIVALHLSGIREPKDLEALKKTRADGALMGEALMREDDPTSLLEKLVLAAKR